MLKKTIKQVSAMLLLSVVLSSCYTYTTVVGDGAQGSKETQQWNNYFIYGLAPGNLADPKKLAEGATDYDVKVQHSFVNGLLAALTFGIYTPTTTTVIQ